jgi:hypothetical protein
LETDPTRMCALLVGLPDVTVLGVGDWPRWLRVEIVSNEDRPVCARCAVAAHGHGHRQVGFVDLPCFGRPVRNRTPTHTEPVITTPGAGALQAPYPTLVVEVDLDFVAFAGWRLGAWVGGRIGFDSLFALAFRVRSIHRPGGVSLSCCQGVGASDPLLRFAGGRDRHGVSVVPTRSVPGGSRGWRK